MDGLARKAMNSSCVLDHLPPKGDSLTRPNQWNGRGLLESWICAMKIRTALEGAWNSVSRHLGRSMRLPPDRRGMDESTTCIGVTCCRDEEERARMVRSGRGLTQPALVITCIELGPTKRLLKRWRMHNTCIGLDNDTAEAATIVGSRQVKHVELEGGLPALAITGNA